ncbi:MAG: hypothetical protein GY714_19920 [Desulfobacterales bacterium]|nr:hypothetical protein [Desulfobacterales bacterium]
MKKKSNRDLCLQMYEWCSKEDGRDKSDYQDYLVSTGKKEEFAICWACIEARGSCRICPIEWSKDEDKSLIYPSSLQCMETHTAYDNWKESLENWGRDKRVSTVKHAKAIIKLIKDTWKE